MSFFRIDLNRLEDPSLALRKERRENRAFMVLAALFCVLVVAVGKSTGALGAKLKELRAMRADLKSQVEALERDSNYVGEEDVKFLYDLERKRVLWTRKLASLAGLVGERIVLTEIRYQRGQLTVQGVAEVAPGGAGGNRFELVSAFIDSLQGSPEFGKDFRKVEFHSSKRLDFQDQNLINFDVICLPR